MSVRWALFGKYAQRHNYTSWANHDCTGYPSIPPVNVGPRGEYNRKWVKPGQKLLDFGGHELPSDVNNANAAARKKAEKARGASSSNTINLRNRLPAHVDMKTAMKTAGMTLSAAESVVGIGNLGKSSPPWE